MTDLHITPTADQIKPDLLQGRIAVVIDVLRATSVIVTALANGANWVKPVTAIEDALALKADDVLVAGERDAERIPGFDLGNSPLEFTPQRVNGKGLVLSTTNGTMALAGCKNAHEVLVGSFLNHRAVSDYLLAQDKPVELVCAGTNNEFSLDDFLCAGLISASLIDSGNYNGGDLVNLCISTWKSSKNDLHKALAACKHYNTLKSKESMRDLDYCLRPGTHHIIPVMKKGFITPA